MDEGAPGAEVLDSNDDMDEDNEIPVEIPQCSLTDFKKQDAAANAFLGTKSFTTGRQLVGLKKKL